MAVELAPSPDPWEVCRRLAGLPHVLFFDSVAGPAFLCRYSFVTADPVEWLWSRGRSVHSASVDSASVHSAGRSAPVGADPFRVVAERLAKFNADTLPDLPPFQGGVAGLFGYDLCHHLERLPRPKHDDFVMPEMAVGVYDWVIAFDHVRRRAWIISTGYPEVEPAARRRRAERRLAQVQRWLDEPPTPGAWEPQSPIVIRGPHHALRHAPGVFSNFSRPDYLAAVQRAIDYVVAGDCFQVNLAQRLLHVLDTSPLDLYGRLRARNPAPFAGYFDLGDFAVVSASPERFVQVQQGEVLTRPIKGTRPRGQTPAEDDACRRELLASAKDRAENVMIVDLMRNDLGRVCQYGSVRVESVCRLESYQYVHHLVSEVRGRLRAGLGPVDLLRAACPGGSVTGAPKIRAMEIIAELEPHVRGPYCGCLGYLGFDGAMDTNLLIRTFTAGKGWLQFPVGGGIVADSDPIREYEETFHKAEGLLRAI